MIQIAATPKTAQLAGWIGEELSKLSIDFRSTVGTSVSAIEQLEDIEILVSIMVPCGAAEFDLMPRLGAIVSPLLGYEWIDLAEATRRNVAVANGEVEENRLGMAEATIMLLLAQLYDLRTTELSLRANKPDPRIRRNLLSGKTVGIIGCGGIARLVIERLAAWKCNIVFADKHQTSDLGPARCVNLDELLETSDAILLLTNLTSETRHILGAEEFAKIRTGTILVNTARGGLIDEDALVTALANGTIRSAALDVFEQEPLRTDHPFRDFPNLILTPHCIGHNEEGRKAVPRVAAENVRTFRNGLLPTSCKNPTAISFAER